MKLDPTELSKTLAIIFAITIPLTFVSLLGPLVGVFVASAIAFAVARWAFKDADPNWRTNGRGTDGNH